MIVLQNISKSFPSEGGGSVEAVRNVSLRVGKGEIQGVIGFSGAGKSTLVRCINLLERPDAGEVFVGGVELTALSDGDLRAARKKIGMIFQQFNLFASRTAWGNVAYPLQYSMTRADRAEKVAALLRLVGLEDKGDAYPSQLSGGQKQRVAIARALANEPSVLLCDEATSALDPQTTLSILRLLKELNVKLGLTIVVITHEMQVVKEICDRVAVMENGEIVEEGDVFSVFAAPKKQITRDFIDTTSNLSKIHALIAERSPLVRLKPGERIVRLRYVEKNVSEALISTISRKFDVNANIIFGDIEFLGGAPIGGLIIIVSGQEDRIESALSFLRSRNVSVEVISDEPDRRAA
ncbi:MAG: ATP-binding cassette domain-containing protein [Synergistaceae bacterium]|jgi:D-methionine transport system ATP-binding protein|nr:ATP-binding cassette domain-containing protein [Synergistaceae bacterium]